MAADSPKSNVEVLNFGVSAYCTAAEMELLATKGIRFNPETVVLLFVENDFDNFNREAFPLGQTIQRPRLAEWLFRNSQLARLTFLQLNLFQVRAELDPVQWNSRAIGDNNVVHGLARFRKLADDHGFQPLIAIWPRFEQYEIVDPHSISNSSELIVEALAKAHGLPTFRLSNHFRRELANAAGKSPRLLLSQGDELHPSAKAAQIAARAIYGQLKLLRERPDVAKDADRVVSEVPTTELTQALEAVSSRSPTYARVHNRIGDQLLRDGKLQEAIESYRRALAEEPENAASHNNLGIALERTDSEPNIALAIDQYRRAIAIQSDFSEAHFNLARALRIHAAESHLDEAQQLLIRAVQLRPEFVAAHFELSKLLSQSGRNRAAEAGLRRVLELDGNYVSAWRLLANELAKQQRLPEAREAYEKLVALEPEDAEALNNLGAICSLLSDNLAAIRYLEAAIAADPNHPKAAENLRRLRQ